jgi:hypothetical protein
MALAIFLSLSPATHRHRRDQRLIDFLGTGEAVKHAGIDRAWPDSVYPNA